MIIAGAGSGTSIQQAVQAFARTTSQHSDSLSITVQVTDGWTANLYEYDNGNFDTIGLDNNSLSKAMNEKGPFAEDPVTVIDADGYLTYHIPSFSRILGYDSEELVGEPITQFIHPDDQEPVLGNDLAEDARQIQPDPDPDE